MANYQPDYFVDYSKNDDSGDGYPLMADAKKHLSAVLALFTLAIDADITVHVRGDVTAPEDWNYGEDGNDTSIDFSSLIFSAGCVLTILTCEYSDPTVNDFDMDAYANGYTPYENATGALDPTATKPCTIPKVILGDIENQDISIMGFAIAPYQPTTRQDKGVDFDEETEDVNLVFCKVSNFGIGVYGVEDAEIVLENCFLDNNTYGLVADAEARAVLSGNNFIRNSLTNGVVLRAGGHLVVTPWSYNRGAFNTLRIDTDIQRSGYAAIHASLGSLIMLEPPHRDFFSNDAEQVFIKIINEAAFNAKDYYGIVLESRAMLTGKDNICFTDQSFNQGQPTVPPGSQIVTAAKGNSVVAG
jgi:hypothetical protein